MADEMNRLASNLDIHVNIERDPQDFQVTEGQAQHKDQHWRRKGEVHQAADDEETWGLVTGHLDPKTDAIRGH